MKELTKEEIQKLILSECFLGVDKTVLKLGHYIGIYSAMQEYSDQNTKQLIDEIAKLKASKSESNEWISVLLGLPNNGIEVSVRLDCAYNGNGIIEPKSSAKFNHSTKYWESGLSTLYSVTHWKPLI